MIGFAAIFLHDSMTGFWVECQDKLSNYRYNKPHIADRLAATHAITSRQSFDHVDQPHTQLFSD